jgi:hypothetical protein
MMTITGTLLAGFAVVTVALDAPFPALVFGGVAMWCCFTLCSDPSVSLSFAGRPTGPAA